MKYTLLLTAIAAMLLSACTGSSNPSPRPRGFARANVYADSLVCCTISGIVLKVNAEAAVTKPQPAWLNVDFSRYSATLYISALKPASPQALDAAIANRSERISLNLAGRSALVSDFKNPGGFDVRLVDASEPAPVPLQFMATDSARTVFVSGAVAFTGPVEPADSVAPALSDLRRQLMLTLNSLELCHAR